MSKNNGLFKVDNAAIIRTGVLLLALVNTSLQLFGVEVLPFAAEDVEIAITVVLNVVASLVVWWRNNSFTKAAQKGDKITRLEKAKVKREKDGGK